MTSQAALITVDWGTTSRRASLLDARGVAVDRREDALGILAVAEQRFAEALLELVGPWRKSAPAIPILLSGMIGSRQGWKETMYVPCPAGLDEVAAGLLTVAMPVLGPDLGDVRIVPGLDVAVAGMPDVMRGEETQIFGAGVVDGLCVLPGTHSKWATVTGGRITRFSTYMTGEVFSALCGHTILGRLMRSASGEVVEAGTSEVFLAAVKAGAAPGGPGALLHRIFSTRTLGLFDKVPADALVEHLSGLLVGAEIADAAHGGRHLITVVANDALAARYVSACQALGLQANRAPSTAAERGAFAIAQAAGLVRKAGAT